MADDAKRLATKPDVVEAYTNTNWDGLNDAIKDVVVDLRYRGDYDARTRKKIQNAIAANDLNAFKSLMSDRDYWVKQRGVPPDRFERRKKPWRTHTKKDKQTSIVVAAIMDNSGTHLKSILDQCNDIYSL